MEKLNQKPMNLKNGHSMISLFSGCGGLDHGLSQAGFRTIFATDIDSICAMSYRANCKGIPFYEGPIEEINYNTLINHTNHDLGNIDLLAGGPPCPPFSKSRFYRKDKPRALEDPNGMSTISGYLRILEKIQPRAFLIENVPGLAYKVHREALDHILSVAENMGYACSGKVLNAANYGIPQKRERFFLIGMKGQKFIFPPQTHINPEKRDLFTNHCRPWKTAGDAISDLDTEENADDNGHFAGGKHHNLLKLVPPGDNYLFFTEKRGYPDPIFKWRSRYWSFLLKLSPNLPSWTIQARRSNNMGPFHWRNRILRVEEVKRLQTFPDGWELHGTIEQQWRQVGNAVPPDLAKVLGRAIINQLG
jgi:DNA (cytosine-5)-methyltransferase 1